jgi:hypothetical protein
MIDTLHCQEKGRYLRKCTAFLFATHNGCIAFDEEKILKQ